MLGKARSECARDVKLCTGVVYGGSKAKRAAVLGSVMGSIM